MKKLNSLANVQKAIDFEIQRQTELLLNHCPVPRQTRRFDEKTQKTIAMRDKELLADYRYYPEPNILPVRLPWQWIESIKDHLPVLPAQRRDKYLYEYKLSVKEADTTFMTRLLNNVYIMIQYVTGLLEMFCLIFIKIIYIFMIYLKFRILRN